MFKYIIVIFCLLFISVKSYGYSYTYSTDPSSSANQVSSQVSNAYNSGSINNSLINPLLNSNTHMTTLNGQTSFSAQISCPSASDLLQLNFLPLGSGDFELLIAQNTTPATSNSFNYTATVPLISGVCTNGFIACDAGTWNNCSYYQWGVNNSGGIIWNSVTTLQSLGTCFCVNNSCGNLFISDFKTIAGTIGGGLSMLIAQTDDVAISNAQYNMQAGYQLSYFGQSSTNCQSVSGSGGYVNPQQYYNNSAAMTNDEQTMAASQSTDTSSPYYSLTNSEYLKNNPVTEKTCSIDNSVTINTTIGSGFNNSSPISTNEVGVGAGGGSSCANGSCWGSSANTITLSTNNPWSTCSPTELPGGITLSGSTMTGSGACSGTITLSSSGINPGGQITCNLGDDGCNAGGVLYFSGGGDNLEISGSNSGTITLSASYNPVASHNNECTTLANNTKCQLETEQVCDENGQNCVYTVQDYNSTGITPQSMCETVNNPVLGASNSYYWSVCANGSNISYTSNDPADASGTILTSSNNNDYWNIQETYTCKSSAPSSYNYTDMENRTNEINSSLNASGGTSYTDIEYNSNGTTTQVTESTDYSGNNAVAAGLGSTPCTYSCVVESSASNSQVLDTNADTTDTALNGAQPANTVASKTILTCTQSQAEATGSAPSNSTWVCPATSSETILKNCQCLDESNYAIATMSVLGQAANSMICSAN